MNNIVEFALRLRDMASQPLRQFGASASQAFNRASQMTTNLSSHNRVLGQSYNELQARIRQVDNVIRTSTIPSQIRAARRELEALQRQSSRHPGNMGGGGGAASGGGLMGMMGGMGGMLKGAGIGLAVGGLAALGAGIADSIGKSLERQQVQTSFNVLAGSEDKGGALTKQLVGLQKDTVLGGEVFKNAQTMMGFGFQSEEVYDNLKMLGDVSMGDADRLQALTLAFSQTRAAGKLTGQDLLQYINAGFNPLEQLQKTLGKTPAELMRMKEAGEISFGMVQQAFKDATSEGGRFDNMLGKIAETPAGKIQQLSGAWDEFKVSAGTAFMPLVAMALNLASKLLPVVEGVIAPLAAGVQNVVAWLKQAAATTGGWMDYVNIIRGYLADHLVPLITKVWNTVVQMVASLFDFIGKSQLLKDIFASVGQVVGFIADTIGVVVDSLAWLFNNVVMPILNGIEAAHGLMKSMMPTGNLVHAGQWNGPKVIIPPVPAVDKKEQQSTQELLTNIATNTAANNSSAKGTEGAIGGGGQKVVNIQVGKFLDSINLTTMNMQEGAAEVEKIILEMFARVVTQR